MSTPIALPFDLSAGTVELTREICDEASVSGTEAHLVDRLVATLEGLDHLELIRHGNTLTARTNLGRAQRVIIAGHVDTVPINNNLPIRRELVDGIDHLIGRGTVDMKGGVAVQVALAAELTDPAVDITWMWYDNEEVSSDLNGLRLLAEARPDLFEGDFAILGEPTRAEIEGGCNGTVRIEVRTRGLRAHSARAWVGENAIHAAAPILEKLAAYQPAQIEVEGLVYREGLNAVGITGGIAGNVIPDECMVHINYRFAPNKSADEAIAHLTDLFGEWDITVVDRAEGARPGLDAPLAKRFLTALGVPALPKYGWTDVARFSALGIPAVNYGPGDPLRAHADDERVAVAEIEDCERGLRAWLSTPDAA